MVIERVAGQPAADRQTNGAPPAYGSSVRSIDPPRGAIPDDLSRHRLPSIMADSDDNRGLAGSCKARTFAIGAGLRGPSAILSAANANSKFEWEAGASSSDDGRVFYSSLSRLHAYVS